jgi:SP family sugar:H+ symporter-like MFS transporter
MGIGFVWALILGLGILLFPESPEYAYSKGRPEDAKNTMTKMLGVSENHRQLAKELRDMKKKLDAENAGNEPWHAVFTGPRMGYLTSLGIALQASQQLTGANFSFVSSYRSDEKYPADNYSTRTTIFVATGISNS